MKIRTLSPAGGWVTVAVTRHTSLPGSTAADSMVVLGNAKERRLSQDRAASPVEKSGLGGMAGGPGGGPPRWGPCAIPVTAGPTTRVAIRMVRFMSVARL